jgi:hypothetical protein
VLTGQDLFEQLSWHWEAQLRPRFEGLTFAELHWEPVPGCWGVHDGVLDQAWPTPSPTPVTTIAWRLAHLGLTMRHRASAHFGAREFSVDVPADLLGFVDAAYGEWSAGVLGADQVRMARAHQGPPGSADESYPLWAVVLHVSREVIHHGAEVALLRDLYARLAS